MATNSYDIRVNVTQAEQALDRLQNSVKTTTAVFDRMKTALAGLAVGSILRSLGEYADTIDDIAKANNLAIETVLGFGRALEYNGGRADAAATGLATFTSNISEAADGSLKLQDTFLRLGVSLDDLRNLSEAQILNKVIAGLEKTDNASLRASLSTTLFGRALKGVDLKGFAADFATYSTGSASSAQSIRAAAQANENFAKAITAFKIQLLEALQPVSELAAKMLEFGSTAKSVIKFVLDFALALASLFLIFRGFRLAVTIFAALGETFVYLGTVVANLFRLVRGLLDPLTRGNLFKNWEQAGGIFKALAVTFGAVTEGVKLGIAAIGVFFATIYAGWQSIKEFLGWGDKAKETADKAAEGDKAAANAARELQDALAKKANEIRRISQDFADQNSRIREAIDLDARLIGTSKEYSDTIRAQEELLRRSAEQIDKLREAKANLSAEEIRGGLGAVYDEQIRKIQQLTEVEKTRLEAAIAGAARLQALEQVRLFGIKARIDTENELMDIQHRMATSTMSEIERKYADIEFAAKKSAKAAIEAEEARTGRRLDPEEQRRYYEEALKGTEQLKQAHEAEYENSRRFSTGWSRAFRDYADNATNAARTAERLFVKATQGMEDALIKFAKTGKFEWKNFVNMMLEELLRAQIQMVFAKILGGMRGSMGGGGGGGGGGLLGGLGGLFGGLFGGGGGAPQGGGAPRQEGGGLFGGISRGIGKLFSGMFANGGVIPAGRFGIVGERGPEFVGGPASVTPMTGTNVTYNINAVDAASFRALVARDPGFIYAVTMQGAKGVPGAM